MNMQILHEVAFYLMYACAALALFVIVERGLFFGYTLRQAVGLERAMTHAVQHVSELPAALTARQSLPLTLVSDILAESITSRPTRIWKISVNRSTSPIAAKYRNGSGFSILL